MCPQCRHCREPVRPSAFAPGTLRSARQFAAATRELAEQERERGEEESRVLEGLRFDARPQFFSWCAKFTLSQDEIDELNHRMRAGDHRLARAVVDKRREFFLADELRHEPIAAFDGTEGALVPVYALCLRVNPEPYECAAFEERA